MAKTKEEKEEEKKKKERKELEEKTVLKPTEEEERKAAGRAYISEREKLASQAGVSSKSAARALIPQEQLLLQQELGEEAAARRAIGAEALGAEEFAAQEKAKLPYIDESGNVVYPEEQQLKPETISEKVEPFASLAGTSIPGLPPALNYLINENLTDAQKSKILMAEAGTAAVLAGALLAGKLSSGVKAISGSISGSATTLGGLYFGGKALTDIKGGEIGNIRSEIGKTSGLSSTTLSAVTTGGLTPEEGMDNLRVLAASLDEAERTIKTLGIYNVNYRTNKEYIAIMKEIADARTNIIERIGGIESVARYGSTTQPLTAR